jgi:hydroxymethylpyrimidine kinase/phosphomethylpyrimidine kinase/thiamine-phosphate diphosphorylase
MGVPPIVWSIAGTDSGGAAGLAADLRAADAFGVHLCPVVAAVTAQNSRAVVRIEPLAPELIDAQLAALAADMPPRAVKTGLLGGVAQVQTVARVIDRLRAELGAVALVVDPVLAASSGASFADVETLAAYRELLLPRATLVTPNRREAIALAGHADDVPALARALRACGARAVCVTGGDDAGALALDWIDTEHAQGWLALPRVDTTNTHGTGCTFAASAAAAVALGFVAADALVLSKMATAHALRRGHAAGTGPGPVIAQQGFGADATLLPSLSFGALPRFAAPRARAAQPLDLYAIVDSAARVRAALAAGIRTVQLRIKAPEGSAVLRAEIAAAVAACRAAGAQLFVNDHWRLAIELQAHGVHLGQEDLAQLSEADRAALLASGLAVGVSSHSLWELARAKSLAPCYIACGPVWPTTTKRMPWCPQGLDNLASWCALAGTSVVAVGGILTPEHVRAAASCGADGVCLVRGLGDDPASTVPALARALAEGRRAPPAPVPALPHPSLAANG